MALSEAKKAADKRYTDKLDNIMIRPYREEGSIIRAAAAAAGMSVQAYVLRAIRAWLEWEQTGTVPAAASPIAGPEETKAGDMPVPESGFGVSAGSPEESGQLPKAVEDRASRGSRDADRAAGDWTARLSRSPNRSRTIKVIKRITETARDGDENDQ